MTSLASLHRILAAFLVAASFPTLPAWSQIPRTISYQGVLTDSSGNPKPDGDYIITFRLYDSSAGGTELYLSQKEIPVKNGLFAAVLGDQPPFGATVKFDRSYWLSLELLGVELVPRIPLGSAAYSQNAVRADTAGYALAADYDTSWTTIGENIYRAEGNVGIGTSTPEYPLSVAGRIKSTLGLAVPSDLPGAGAVIERPGFVRTNLLRSSWAPGVGDFVDIAPTGNDGPGGLLRITGHGKVGIGTETPQAGLEVADYTKLGSDAPAIKVWKTGWTMPPTQGGETVHSIPADISKVIFFSVLVEVNRVGSGVELIGPNNSTSGVEFSATVIRWGVSDIFQEVLIHNSETNSSHLLSRPYRLVVVYEE